MMGDLEPRFKRKKKTFDVVAWVVAISSGLSRQ